MEKCYLCIDLKSFYASVECVERGLDPMNTNLVVADASRTEKTICLAVTPSLKAYGVSGRARLFEVEQRVKEVNRERKKAIGWKTFNGDSCFADDLKNNPFLELSYLVAPPRMGLYMKWSTLIYNVYLKFIAPEDIHVYSIDEVFMDLTNYLKTYGCTPRELAEKIIREVLENTGITATAGIGTNLYLAKIAMDVMAKKIPADERGVRIAQLDELTYRKELWSHKPLTDFWRIGKGYARKLEENRLYTMGDIARFSLTGYGEDKLYKLFGVNAELLIDHAWGWEPCTIQEIKAYRPENRSLGSGQVLPCPYDYEKARLVVQEMTELLALDLVEKELVTNQVVLTVGYDIENLKRPIINEAYRGEVTVDAYGRTIPKSAHGTENLEFSTSSTRLIMKGVMTLFDRIVNRNLLIRRMNLVANHVIPRSQIPKESNEQLDLFTDYEERDRQNRKTEQSLEKERKIQETTIALKKKFGKNAILKGINLQEGATAMDRNGQIGGHKA